MNEFEAVTASQIDRLVDGELSSTERRGVLMALDHEPDGWRRVALAFLESQALRMELRGAVESRAVPRVDTSPATFAAPAVRAPAMRWRSVLAMAACGLILFGLVRMSRPTVMAPVPNVRSAPETYASNQTNGIDSTHIPVSDPNVDVQKTLRLELGDGSDVEVPVVENTNIRAEDILQGPPVIPVSMQRELLRSGRRVYEQRQLYEVTLEDGRRGIVPVSDVLVENAGLAVYQ